MASKILRIFRWQYEGDQFNLFVVVVFFCAASFVFNFLFILFSTYYALASVEQNFACALEIFSVSLEVCESI